MVQQNHALKSMSQRFTNDFPRRQPTWVPNCDVFVTVSGDLIVCLELSGVKAGDFEIKTNGTRLRVTGDRPSSGLASAQNVLVHEINAGLFESFLDIPPNFDLSRLSSSYVNGALRITIPPASKDS